jgi:hypothetical protein
VIELINAGTKEGNQYLYKLIKKSFNKKKTRINTIIKRKISLVLIYPKEGVYIA